MELEGYINNFAPAACAAFCRVIGMIALVPALARLPLRVRGVIAIAITAGSVPAVTVAPHWPGNWLMNGMALGAEVLIGLALGMAVSLVFVAARWAGDLIGQQSGLGLGQVLDPMNSDGGSPIGEMYSLLCTVVFFTVNGHHALLRSLHASFSALPLLGMGRGLSIVPLVVGLLKASTMLAIQLAAPVAVTMLIVDLVLVVVARGLPQINLMSSGLAVRSLVTMGVMLVGVAIAARAIGAGVTDFSAMLDRALPVGSASADRLFIGSNTWSK
jgi:flagellar biosynthetic protein FliR